MPFKIVVCPNSSRSENDESSLALPRAVRIMCYLAWIARDLGHQVSLHFPTLTGSCERVTSLKCFDIVQDFPRMFGKIEDQADIYISTDGMLLNCTVRYPDVSRRIVYREKFPKPVDNLWCAIPTVIFGPVLCREDFTNYEERNRQLDHPEYIHALKTRVMQTPWLLHELTYRTLVEDGLEKAYLRNDVHKIRQKYASEKVRDFGFIGEEWPIRREIANQLTDSRFTFHFTGDKTIPYVPPILGGDYLRWLSGCKAILDLPGDTWNSYRFSEATMLGVALVEDVSKLPLAAPLTKRNCIPVDSWGDQSGMISALDRIPQIVKNADVTYRDSWSLRGQLKQAIARCVQ